MRASFKGLLPLLLLMTLPAAVEAQFNYTTNNGAITITKYTGGGGAVTIPDLTNGLPVTRIGTNAFDQSTSMTSVTIGTNVTSIGNYAFFACSGLTDVTIGTGVTSIGRYGFGSCIILSGVCFAGNAPSADTTVFSGFSAATVYYLPGNASLGPKFALRPTALWRPLVKTSDGSFGARANQFGFNIAWASGKVVVVEASTNVANPLWSPVGTNTLTAS